MMIWNSCLAMLHYIPAVYVFIIFYPCAVSYTIGFIGLFSTLMTVHNCLAHFPAHYLLVCAGVMGSRYIFYIIISDPTNLKNLDLKSRHAAWCSLQNTPIPNSIELLSRPNWNFYTG